MTGWQAASHGHVFGTQQSRDAVFAYYQRELMRLGWKTTHDPILSTVEADGWAWCKPRRPLSVRERTGWRILSTTGR